MLSRSVYLAALAAGFGLLPLTGLAKDYVWNGNLGADWAAPRNWLPYDALNPTLVLTGNQRYTVSSGTPVLSNSWTIYQTGQVNLAYDTTIATITQQLNIQDDGSLNISRGAWLLSATEASASAVSTLSNNAQVLVTGSGSTWQNNKGTLSLSDYSLISVEHGASVLCDDVLFSGGNQMLIRVQQGGRFTFDQLQSHSSLGRLIVQDGSTVQGTDLYFFGGYQWSDGALQVKSGSKVNIIDQVEIGQESQGIRVTLDGAGTQMTVGGTFDFNRGIINIANGALLRAGTFGQDYGDINIDGANSSLNADLFCVTSNAKVQITNGGMMKATAFRSDVADLLYTINVKSGSTLWLGESVILNNKNRIEVTDSSTLSVHSLKTIKNSGSDVYVGSGCVLEIRGAESWSLALGQYAYGDAWNGQLTAGHDLRLTGQATLSDSLTLNGGHLTLGMVSGFSNLIFTRGTLHFSEAQSISASSGFGSRLLANAGQVWDFQNETMVATDGQIRLRGGDVRYLSLINMGQIRFEDDLSILGSESSQLGNNGLIQGGGTILGSVENYSQGTLLVNSGQTMVISNYMGMTNYGRIHVNGGQLNVGMIQNQAYSTLALTGGSLYASSVNNLGRIDVSSGVSHLFGNLFNTTDGYNSGQLIVFGGELFLHGNLVNDGVITVGAGSTLAIYGDVSGSGSYVNNSGGQLMFTGKISPGHSPGTTTIAGDVTYTSDALLMMELGGSTIDLYDRILASGDILLQPGVDLQIVLYGGYVPQFGQTFDLFDGRFVGTFDQILLPTLSGDLQFDLSRLYSDGLVAVVPEPASLGLLALAAGGLLMGRRQR